MRPTAPRRSGNRSPSVGIRVRKHCCVERLEMESALLRTGLATVIMSGGSDSLVDEMTEQCRRSEDLLNETAKTATKNGPWTEVYVARGATEEQRQALVEKTASTECGVCAGIREDAALTPDEKRARAKANRSLWPED